MPLNLTFTGKIGPGNQLTAASFQNCLGMNLIPNTKQIELTLADGTIKQLDIAGNTSMTITCSSTSTTYTMVVAGS